MLVGERLRAIREAKKLSQGDIERSTGLLRCYLSRCENGHTIPSIDTLEKWARAMGVTMGQLFSEDDHKPEPLKLPSRPTARLSRKDAVILERLSSILPKLDDRDKSILVNMALRMARG